MLADLMCKIAQSVRESGGQAESGTEIGDGVMPRFWICADPLENRIEIGINGASFIGS